MRPHKRAAIANALFLRQKGLIEQCFRFGPFSRDVLAKASLRFSAEAGNNRGSSHLSERTSTLTSLRRTDTSLNSAPL